MKALQKNSLLEKELKYRLTNRDYNRLKRLLRPRIVRHDRLDTYYLDDSALSLRENRYGLRVRITNGKQAAVTLKFPAKTRTRGPKAYKVKHEYENVVRFPTAQKIIRGETPITFLSNRPIKLLRKRFPEELLGDISTLGRMTTFRTLAKLESLALELDKCILFGKRFYELEVETDAPFETDAAIRTFFRENGVKYLPSKESKLSRFLKEWKKR